MSALYKSYCTEDFTSVMHKGWQGEIIHSCSNSVHSKGVCMLLKKGLECKILSTLSDGIGRLLLVNIEVNGVNSTLCNVYCPNNVTETVNILSHVKLFGRKHAISKQNMYIGGDFNCVESRIDRVSGVLDRSSSKLTEIKKYLNLVDVW